MFGRRAAPGSCYRDPVCYVCSAEGSCGLWAIKEADYAEFSGKMGPEMLDVVVLNDLTAALFET